MAIFSTVRLPGLARASKFRAWMSLFCLIERNIGAPA